MDAGSVQCGESSLFAVSLSEGVWVFFVGLDYGKVHCFDAVDIVFILQKHAFKLWYKDDIFTSKSLK